MVMEINTGTCILLCMYWYCNWRTFDLQYSHNYISHSMIGCILRSIMAISFHDFVYF